MGSVSGSSGEGGISERYNRGLAGGYNTSYIPPYAQAVQAAYAANPSIAGLTSISVAGGVNFLGKNYNNWTQGTNRVLPNVSMVFAYNPRTVLRMGYGFYSDTFNAFNTRPGQNGFSQTTTTPVSTDNGLTFCCGGSPLNNPFPTLASGTHLVQPFGSSLGPDTLDGQGLTYYPRDYSPALTQRWKVSIQREVMKDQVLDVSYNGSYASYPFNENLSYLPGQYWASGNTYNATEQAAMTANVTNPFYIGNLTGLQSSNPALYNYLNTISWFTSKTLQTQQLLRGYLNAGAGLTEAGAVRAQSWYSDAQFLYTKRFSNGVMSSLTYTRAFGRQQWQPNSYNPSLAWELNPNTRPNRIVWSSVWELPFGRGRRWLTTGPAQHVVGGWQLSWIYQYQTGAPVSWGNLFYYGSVSQVVDALAESATHAANSRQEYSTAAVYSPVFNSSDSATGAIPSGFVGFEGPYFFAARLLSSPRISPICECFTRGPHPPVGRQNLSQVYAARASQHEPWSGCSESDKSCAVRSAGADAHYHEFRRGDFAGERGTPAADECPRGILKRRPYFICSKACTPFHKICTPIHTSKNEDNRMITLIAVAPSARASRSANR